MPEQGIEPLFDSGSDSPRIYHDTIVMAVPDSLSPMVDGVLVIDRMRPLIDRLDDKARKVLAEQYPHSTLVSVDWTFATTPEHAAAWPLPHDCDKCREGRYNAITSLTVDPDRVIALGDMTCEEPGSDSTGVSRDA